MAVWSSTMQRPRRHVCELQEAYAATKRVPSTEAFVVCLSI